MENFFGATKRSLEALCMKQGWPSQHASKVFSEIYRQRTSKFEDIKSIPTKMVQYLNENYNIDSCVVKKSEISSVDKSVKFLVEMKDGSLVETVLIPEVGRFTVCVSSQVGCAQACSFCYTGRMGLKRNLTAGEIVFQVYAAAKFLNSESVWRDSVKTEQSVLQITNVVFMGMGEPLDNVIEVAQSVKILTDCHGLSISLKKISISTAGHLDGVQKMRVAIPGVRFAFSLHGPNDSIRKKIMPITRRWSVKELVEEIRDINRKDKNPVFIQYILIDGVNDSIECALELRELLHDLDVKVNLIPFNDVAPSSFKSPNEDKIKIFQDALYSNKIRTMVRYSKGQDIGAACGQLVDKEILRV